MNGCDQTIRGVQMGAPLSCCSSIVIFQLAIGSVLVVVE